MMYSRKLGDDPWPRLWLMTASILWLLAGSSSWGLKITNVQVPKVVREGDTVHLVCKFDVEDGQLYSLTWWREQHQFYQFTPAATKVKSKYDTHGIQVDEARSSMNTVVLTNVSHDTAGRYKCEVVADFTFEKDFQLKDMEVVVFPDRIPVLEVWRRTWSPGEQLAANCTSLGGRPSPLLQWFTNGDEVSKRYTRMLQKDTTNMGQVSTRSELRLPLGESHFKEGQVRLTCSASFRNFYNQSSDIMLNRLGFKTVAPSQKLYGTGSTMEVNVVMLVLAFMVTASLLVM